MKKILNKFAPLTLGFSLAAGCNGQLDSDPWISGSHTNLSTTIEGSADPSGVSWKEHFVDLQAGETVNATLRWGTSSDLNLFIYDLNANLVDKSNGSARPETVSYEATRTGNYRIGIKAKSGSATSYDLELDITQPINTLQANAKGGAWITHPISVPQGASSITVELSWARQDLNLNLFLQDPDGNGVASSNGAGFPESITYNQLYAGTWTLAIKHKGNTATDYAISYRFIGAVAPPAPSPEQPASVVDGKLVPEYGVLFGSNGDFQEPGGSISAFRAREELVDRQFDIYHAYERIGDRFPNSGEIKLANEGRVLFHNWKPQNHQSWRSIANGNHDVVIRTTARDLKAFGQPMFLAFHHEMDTGHNGEVFGSSADYVAAYRRVHNIFRAENANNVIFVWNPTGWNPSSMTPFYPGGAYVDWIGFNMYNWAYCRGDHDRWRSFEEMIRPVYDWARRNHPSKPIMLPEWGAQEGRFAGESRAAWFDAIIPTIKSEFPALKALVYFDVNVGFQEAMCQWQVDSTTSALNAYRRLVHDDFTNVAHTAEP